MHTSLVKSCFSGFIIDLIWALSRLCDFTFEDFILWMMGRSLLPLAFPCCLWRPITLISLVKSSFSGLNLTWSEFFHIWGFHIVVGLHFPSLFRVVCGGTITLIYPRDISHAFLPRQSRHNFWCSPKSKKESNFHQNCTNITISQIKL